MPRRCFVAACVNRRVRALARGYIHRAAEGHAHIEVPSSVLPAAKLICRSLATHVAHDLLAGRPHHYARLATSAAFSAGHIDKVTANKAQREHRAAGKAKHEISRLAATVSHVADEAAGVSLLPPVRSRDLRDAELGMFELFSDEDDSQFSVAPSFFQDEVPQAACTDFTTEESHIIDTFLAQCGAPNSDIMLLSLC
mmetsp:Transcript_31027/g.78500  ORF Transcript_31027/g.78500 Transcript_31027/m.78500 type:complete len:197 (-) Transcript_31027:692-1282(-)